MFIVERLACDNRWRTRHPGEKLILGGGLLLVALVLPPWPGAVLVLLAAVLAALLGARLPVGSYLRVLAVPAGFLLAGSAALAVSVDTSGGGPLLAVRSAGLQQAGEASLRAIAATASLLLIVLTTPLTDLLAVLRRLRLSPLLGELMLMSWRFSVLTVEMAATARAAQAARLGYSGASRSLRSAGLLAAHLLPRALDRAARMQIGLASRGYSGELRVLAPAHGFSRLFVAATLVLQTGIVLLSLAAGGMIAGTHGAP